MNLYKEHEENLPKHMIIKWFKTSEKNKILKATGGKKKYYIRKSKKMETDFFFFSKNARQKRMQHNHERIGVGGLRGTVNLNSLPSEDT